MMDQNKTVDSLDRSSGTAPRRKFLVPRFIANEIATWKELGLRGYIRKRGIRFFVLIFLYYLVRDTTLYVIIPYLVVSGVIGCPGPGAGP